MCWWEGDCAGRRVTVLVGGVSVCWWEGDHAGGRGVCWWEG